MRSYGSLNILYIEDNDDDVIILEELLGESVTLGRFKTCSRLNDGIEELGEFDYDLILMDLTLPDAQGIEGVKYMFDFLNESTPVVILSGLKDHLVSLEAIKLGAQDYLVKGEYNSALLAKTVQYAIERHNSQKELMINQNALLQVTDRLSKAEEMADLGSWEINVESDEIILSEGMMKLLRIDTSNGNVLGFHVFVDFIHPDDRGIFARSLVMDRDHDELVNREIRFVRKNEEIITISRTQAEFNENGKPIHVYGVSLDISGIKEVEKVKEEFTQQLAVKVQERTSELEQTQIKLQESLSKEMELSELKSRFVSTASHQFRTPLAVIQSNLGLLEMQIDMFDDSMRPKVELISKRIKGEVKRMTSLMNDVLILGKITIGGVLPEFKMIDVVKVTEDIVNKFNLIQKDGRKADVEVNGDKTDLSLDQKLFEHSLSNVLSNAFKYSVDRPSPMVRVNFGKDAVSVEVEDFGIGIPKEDLTSLFDPFYRASNAVDIQGTGLGTSIIKEYTDVNNGVIDIESEMGKGSIFTLTFEKN